MGDNLGHTDALGDFRQRFYKCAGRRADALFELADAILTAGTVTSTAHLSLTATHRREWNSLYAALSKGRIGAEALRELLAATYLGDEEAPVYAVDVSPRPRCDAEASPGRGYFYHPSRHSAGQPIVAGWTYQLVAGLSFERDSWATPVDARRVKPDENANDVAAEQVRQLADRLPQGRKKPLFVFDAGYDPVRLQKGLEVCRAEILVRLHSGRSFYADPDLREKRPVGRPSHHGRRFSCEDSSTWPAAASWLLARSTDYGDVRVRAWSRLHPKMRRAAQRYGTKTAVVAVGTVVLVEVDRLPRGERRRKPKALWLWWHGEGEPDLDLIWRSYCRRFDVEHLVRFLKGSLG